MDKGLIISIAIFFIIAVLRSFDSNHPVTKALKSQDDAKKKFAKVEEWKDVDLRDLVFDDSYEAMAASRLQEEKEGRRWNSEWGYRPAQTTVNGAEKWIIEKIKIKW